MVTRRDGTSSSGWVNWPTDLYNTNEGGMFVVAVVPMSHFEEDPFVHCCEVGNICLHYSNMIDNSPTSEDHGWILEDGSSVPLTDARSEDYERLAQEIVDQGHEIVDVYQGPRALEVEVFPFLNDEDGSHLSAPMLAAVTLGSSGGSWWDEAEDHYWNCEYEDLNSQGRALFDSLELLYDRPVKLLTFLDT